jgi:predicted HAD superfamily Cof-like phosphohydrolase
MVKEFHEKFGVPVKKFPGPPDASTVQFRVDLIQEECNEFCDACGYHNFLDAIDALVDILYVTYGAALAFGVDLEPIFKEVHRANMTKTGGHRRADGKVLKPADFVPPNLAPIIQKQKKESAKSWDK